MADSTLTAIQNKVRRLSRNPSEQQLTTAEIDEYVNTFIQYDLPYELRLNTLKTNLTFYTQPNIDTYETNSISGDPLENFKDKYSGVFDPLYINGYESRLYQSQAEFYGTYPLTNTGQLVGSGSGTATITGTLNSVPVLRGSITFSSTEAVTGDNLVAYDDSAEGWSGDVTGGTIDYVTGAYSITFSGNLAAGANINASWHPYSAARPDSVLYFENKFVIRPIPDKTYPVKVQVSVRPTELLNTAQSPELEQWWQYIAYGATKKIFEDRTDIDSVKEIMPEFNKQERLVLRRTLINQAKQRSSTIYSDGAWIGYGARSRYGAGKF